MRRPLQGQSGASVRRASRRPAGERRAAGAGPVWGPGVLVGQRTLRPWDRGFGVTGLARRRGLGRTGHPVGVGMTLSSPSQSGGCVAGAFTFGCAPAVGASGGARGDLVPGLPGQAVRRLALAWRGAWGWGCGTAFAFRVVDVGSALLRLGRPVSGRTGPSLRDQAWGQTPPCAGAAINHSCLGEGAPSSKSTPLREAVGANPPVFGQGLQTGFHPARTSVRRSSPRLRGCVIAGAREPAGCPAGT